MYLHIRSTALLSMSSKTPNLPPRRNKFLERLRSGESSLQDPRDAEQFLKAMQNAPEQLVLMFNKNLFKCLKDAIMILYPRIGLVENLLGVLGNEKLSFGILKTKVFSIFKTIYETPGFMDCLMDQLQNENIQDPACIAWFLLKLSSERDVREDHVVIKMVDMLSKRSELGVSTLSRQLSVVFHPTTYAESMLTEPYLSSMNIARQSMRPPGLRDHDNDMTNFRDICVIPTPNEVDCEEQPYLPHPGGAEFIASKEASTLDRLFRQLREGLIGPLRSQLQELADGKFLQAGQHASVFSRPRFCRIDIWPEPNIVVSVSMQPRLAARVGKLSRVDAARYFDTGPGRRILAQDSLVLLMDKNPKVTPGKRTLAVGRIVARSNISSLLMPDGDGGSSEDPRLTVGVSFHGASMKAVAFLLGEHTKEGAAGRDAHADYLFSSSSKFFKYAPTLHAIKEMQCVPLGDKLLHGIETRTPNLAHSGRRIEDFSPELGEAVKSSSEQRAALQCLFNSSVILVQGQSCTGKTYIGVQMVKAMLEAEEAWGEGGLKVLYMCRTKRALDSFLEALISAGVQDKNFIRLGKSSPRLRRRSVSKLNEFDRIEEITYHRATARQLELDTELRSCEAQLAAPVWGSGAESWAVVSEFLREKHPKEFDQLNCEGKVLAISEGPTAEAAAPAVPTSATTTACVNASYLWDRWCGGKSGGVLETTNLNLEQQEVSNSDGSGSLWRLNREQRALVQESWRQEWAKPLQDTLASVLEDIHLGAQLIQDLHISPQRSALQNVTVIGCTAVNAAKLRGPLNQAAPTVVIVEEADEIHEAQILSVLGHKCQQLIMFGEHKQQSSKVGFHHQSKAARNALENFVSLFDRLVATRAGQEPGSASNPNEILVLDTIKSPDWGEGSPFTGQGGVPAAKFKALTQNRSVRSLSGKEAKAMRRQAIRFECLPRRRTTLTDITGLKDDRLPILNRISSFGTVRTGAKDPADLQSYEHSGCFDEETLGPLPRSKSLKRYNKKTNHTLRPAASKTQNEDKVHSIIPLITLRKKFSPGKFEGPDESFLTGRFNIKSDSAQEIKDIDDLAQILNMYGIDDDLKNVLRADNLLDRVIMERTANHTLPCPEFLIALHYIFECEIDPTSELHRKQYSWHKLHVETISEAICCWAMFLHIRKEFPQQASVYAGEFVSYVMNLNTSFKFPKVWVDQAQHAITNPNISLSITKEGPKISADAQWNAIAKVDALAPDVMTNLIEMIGLEEIKLDFIKLYHRVKLSQEQNDGPSSSYNVRFEGNPGTGKTSIARIYGQFLKQLGVLSSSSIFIETSGSSLCLNGVQSLVNDLDKAKKAGGAVIFVDEAYQLISDRSGEQVLNYILPLAESLQSQFGSLVWIFAGYQKDMEKLFEYNIGLMSRFPLRYKFKDYEDEELMRIFSSLMIHQQHPISSKFPESKPATTVMMPKAPELETIFGSSFDGGLGAEAIKLNNSVGLKLKDKFGYEWEKTGNHWQNKFGAVTGYGIKDLGSPENPLVSEDGEAWIYDEASACWIGSKTGERRPEYPGSSQKVKNLKLRETPFKLEDRKDLRIAIRRLGRNRGKAGFGNARAVKILFDRVRDRQADRIRKEQDDESFPDIFLFKSEDLLGAQITEDSLKKGKAYLELQRMEGLAPVKESINLLIKLVVKNSEREQLEKPLLDVVLNRIFIGNPGTGKTTVARIYAHILTEVGLLSRGDVIVKTPSDFIGDVLGSSEKRTRDILKAAEGCVLVIDEAYSLYSGDDVNKNNDIYKTSVIDTIVEQVSGQAGEDRAIILLGYKDEMTQFLKNVNPGLSRRFQWENAFYFPDYDDLALVRILISKARANGLKLEVQVAKRAVATLAKSRSKSHFGNAGSLDNLLSTAKLRMQERHCPDDNLTPADFKVESEGLDNDVLSTLFDGMIGCDQIKDKLKTLQDTVLFAQERGDDPKDFVSFNYLFVGNPGTGKTTVARKMGKMFKALGILPDDTVYEVAASDLSTGYSGQAGQKTRAELQKSKGGVLFIDEAYQLNPARGGQYMSEAVDELVKCMTSPEFQGKLLIILAGYEKDVNEMLVTNAGLKSRFPEKLRFEDMDSKSAAILYTEKMLQYNMVISVSDMSGLHKLTNRLVEIRDFGNGRDVESWAKLTYQHISVASRKQLDLGGRNLKRQSRMNVNVNLMEIEAALEILIANRAAVPDYKKTVNTSTLAKPLPTNGNLLASPILAQSRPRVRAEAAKRAEVDKALIEESTHIFGKANQEDSEQNLFQAIDPSALSLLQNFLVERGMNSEDGAKLFANLDPSDPLFQALVNQAVKYLGWTPTQAQNQLVLWQNAQKQLWIEFEKEQERERSAGNTMQAIWRCAVCGKADKPWIVCFVAPYIVRYEPVNTNLI